MIWYEHCVDGGIDAVEEKKHLHSGGSQFAGYAVERNNNFLRPMQTTPEKNATIFFVIQSLWARIVSIKEARILKVSMYQKPHIEIKSYKKNPKAMKAAAA